MPDGSESPITQVPSDSSCILPHSGIFRSFSFLYVSWVCLFLVKVFAEAIFSPPSLDRLASVISLTPNLIISCALKLSLAPTTYRVKYKHRLIFKTLHKLPCFPHSRAVKVSISWGECLVFHRCICCSLWLEYTFPSSPFSAKRTILFSRTNSNVTLFHCLKQVKSPPSAPPPAPTDLLLYFPNLIIIISLFCLFHWAVSISRTGVTSVSPLPNPE